MYKVYYEVGDNNDPRAKDYKSLTGALRFAHKQNQDPETGWLDISNQGADAVWEHPAYPGWQFRWYNGASYQLEDLPYQMRLQEA